MLRNPKRIFDEVRAKCSSDKVCSLQFWVQTTKDQKVVAEDFLGKTVTERKTVTEDFEDKPSPSEKRLPKILRANRHRAEKGCRRFWEQIVTEQKSVAENFGAKLKMEKEFAAAILPPDLAAPADLDGKILFRRAETFTPRFPKQSAVRLRVRRVSAR